MKETKDQLTVKERIVIRLVIFVIQMLKPWEYEHQFKAFMKEIKELIDVTPYQES